jgi:hypothetical protein
MDPANHSTKVMVFISLWTMSLSLHQIKINQIMRRVLIDKLKKEEIKKG